MYWPYSDIDIFDFEKRIHITEDLLLKNGATYIKDHTELKQWILQDGTYHVLSLSLAKI